MITAGYPMACPISSRARDHTLYLFCVQLPGSWKSHGAIDPLICLGHLNFSSWTSIEKSWWLRPSENIKKSVGMMTFPTEWKNWKNKKCAKPPTRISATGAPKDPIPNDAT
jgi:hypothetical protein